MIISFGSNRQSIDEEKTENADATPKAPVRLSSSISSLISSNSMMEIPLTRSVGREFLLSSSFSAIKSMSIDFHEHEEVRIIDK